MDNYSRMETRKRKNKVITPKNKKRKIVSCANDDILIFPYEVWFIIFSFLPCKLLNGIISLVCKTFKELVDSPYLWKYVTLDISHKNNSPYVITESRKLFSLVGKFKYCKLQELCIGPMSIGDKTLKRITEKCPKLKKINIINTNGLIESQIEQLRGNNIKELVVNFIHFKVYNPNLFSGFTNLKKLIIGKTDVSANYFLDSIINNCHNLKVFALGNAINRSSLALLGKIKTLETLCITLGFDIDEICLFKSCRELQNLTALEINNCFFVSDNFITALVKICKKIKILELFSHFINQRLSNKIYSFLILSGVKSVNIPICNVLSNYGLSLDYSQRLEILNYLYVALVEKLGLIKYMFLIKPENKQLVVNNSYQYSDVTKTKDNGTYATFLKILFLAQVFEESMFQNNCSVELYTMAIIRKLSDLDITLEKRKQFYMFRNKDELSHNKTIKFIETYMMVWFLGQTEPMVKGQW